LQAKRINAPEHARAYRHSHTHYGWPLIAARIAALYWEFLAAPARAARA
jgi:hypothetical protein